MSSPDPYDDRSFLERFGLMIGLAVVLLLVGGGVLSFYFLGGKMPKPKKPEEVMVHLLPPPLPPPPPPPPPPKVPPPQQPKLVELKPQDKTPPKPEAKNDKPAAAPGPKASGPPSDNGIGGGGGDGGNGIGGGEGGTVFGFYAGQVGEQIREALKRNGKTKDAAFHVKVRVWFDGTGRITRSALAGSTGDTSVDTAIKEEVLAGLQLPPPPQGMPTPVIMNLNAVHSQ